LFFSSPADLSIFLSLSFSSGPRSSTAGSSRDCINVAIRNGRIDRRYTAERNENHSGKQRQTEGREEEERVQRADKEDFEYGNWD